HRRDVGEVAEGDGGSGDGARPPALAGGGSPRACLQFALVAAGGGGRRARRQAGGGGLLKLVGLDVFVGPGSDTGCRPPADQDCRCRQGDDDRAVAKLSRNDAVQPGRPVRLGGRWSLTQPPDWSILGSQALSTT